MEEDQDNEGAFKPTPSELWSAAFSRTQPVWGGEEEIMLPVTGGADVDSGLTLEQDKYLFLEEKLSQDHIRLLYLISSYSKPAVEAEDVESWVRQHIIYCFVFEGIVSGVFNYDYSASSELVGSSRILMNVSQEGKDDLDDLREMNLINTLRLSSSHHQTVTAYQISKLGVTILGRKLTSISKRAVESFIRTSDGELLSVELEDGEFFFRTKAGYSMPSTVTVTEDVSYVSSPYLPNCVRRSARALSNNAFRAPEAASGKTSIRDELSEVVHLGEVRVLLGEYVPLGDNAIVDLCEKLGCRARVQGGMFSDLIDVNPEGVCLDTPQGLTGVRVLEFDLMNFVNYEADIHFAEKVGIVQVENFGVHVQVDGLVAYGLKVDAILNNSADNISLDLLARVLVDVNNDSSRIVDSLISEYQRTLLDLVYYGDRESRDKIVIILAENIDPKMSAELFLDGEDHESELKQILGDTHSAHNLSDEDICIIGRNGILIAGSGCLRFESILFSYLGLASREKFARYFFARSFVLDDALRQIRYNVTHHEEDPNSVVNIRRFLSKVSREVILMDECLTYLEESCQEFKKLPATNLASEIKLMELLCIDVQFKSLKKRVLDMRKNVKGAIRELQSLQSLTDMISQTQAFKLQDLTVANNQAIEELSKAGESQAVDLELMRNMVAGILALALFDRLSGFHLNVSGKTSIEGYDSSFGNFLVQTPGAFFGFGLLFWGLWKVIYLLPNLRARLAQGRAGRSLTVKFQINRKLNTDRMLDFILYKAVLFETVDTNSEDEVRRTAHPISSAFFCNTHIFNAVVRFVVSRGKRLIQANGEDLRQG